MRLFFVLFFLTLFFSCENEEKYYGDWIYDYRYSTVYADTPSRVKIIQDSIKFRYPYFEYWHSFPVKISNNKLEYNNLEFKTVFNKDTLNLSKYFSVFKPEVSIESSQYLREENFVNINLPKTNFNFKMLDALNRSALVLYGKRIDNGQYSLNLNDKYSDFNELPKFLINNHDRHDYLTQVILFCDKNTKLLDLEKMIIQFQVSFKYRIAFVNDIIIDNNTYEPFYNYSILNLKLPPIIENDSYFFKVIGNSAPPPPPPPFIKKTSNFTIIKLIENKFYNDNKELNTSELQVLVEKNIKENNLIISLYDLESNYSSFMEMNGVINMCYTKLRNDYASTHYKRVFNELSLEEQNLVKKEIPGKRIWNYSIPHFNSLIEENGDFLGLKINL